MIERGVGLGVDDPLAQTRGDLEEVLETQIAPELKGAIDWEVD